MSEKIIITSQAEAAVIALNEIQKIDPAARGFRLSKEMQLVTVSKPINLSDNSIFIRHMFPVQLITPTGIDGITKKILEFCEKMPKGRNFSIQMRKTEDFEFPQDLEDELIALGHIKNDAKPDWALSLLIHEGTLYAGASYCVDNLSNWNGGMHRFKKSEDSISRAEFKLLEALAVFNVDLSKADSALDLGAAPGGWSKVLLERGLKVTAVDPALLSASILNHPNLTHIKDVAERLKPKSPFDIIVNDMRMDMMASSKIMLDLSPFLAFGGLVIMTLKLPHKEWYKNTKRAFKLLEKSYTVQGARQLFHNRSEVTVVLKNNAN